jgi:hypothetical protein
MYFLQQGYTPKLLTNRITKWGARIQTLGTVGNIAFPPLQGAKIARIWVSSVQRGDHLRLTFPFLPTVAGRCHWQPLRRRQTPINGTGDIERRRKVLEGKT